MATTYTVVGWMIWAAFVAEFALRAYVAPSASLAGILGAFFLERRPPESTA